MQRILYLLSICYFILISSSMHAAAGSWNLFGSSKDQPHYPAVSPLRALGTYIANNLADTTITDRYETRPHEGFDTWFTKHVESVNILKNAARQRSDIVDKARDKVAESSFIVASPTYEYEFSVNVPASIKTRSTMPVQDIFESMVYEPLVLHVKVRNIQTHSNAGEYDLSVTKQMELDRPNTYVLYDGTGRYSTADRTYKMIK